jgi:hypothetical protein
MVCKFLVSKCRSASNTCMKSARMMGIATCRKRAVKQSDPGALSGGRSLIAAQISSFVKWVHNSHRSAYGRSWRSSLMVFDLEADVHRSES